MIYKKDGYAKQSTILFNRRWNSHWEYDVLEYFTHKTQEEKIPDFIKIIGPYSFNYSSINQLKISSNITTIGVYAFYASRIQTIEISDDSNLETIKNKTFFESSIESFSIPKCLVNLEEGWCSETEHLIHVHPDNPRYIMYGNKIVIGKSSIESDLYDSIIFSSRDIQKVTIPNFIKIIESHAFAFCDKLQTIEIEQNSELQMIKENAFANTSIDKFFVPKQLKESFFKYIYWNGNIKTTFFRWHLNKN